MIKYLENSKIICSEIKDKELQNEWKKQIDAVEYFLQFDNWVLETPTHITFAFSEYDRIKQDKERMNLFIDAIQIIGMTHDKEYRERYTTEEMGHAVYKTYFRIKEIQQERAKKQGIRGIISKIIGALFS